MAGDEQVQQSTRIEEQKVDASKLTPEQTEQAKRGYGEYVKEKGHELYESWIPWIEDQYLSWFTKDNKASYATKKQLDKTKITGIESVNTLQDDVNSLVSHQLGKGGLFQPVGDAISKDGINRTERSGKDKDGNYLPSALAGGEDVAKAGSGYLASAESYVSGAGGTVYNSAKGAAGYVGGILGGKKDAEDRTLPENETIADDKANVENKPAGGQIEKAKLIPQTKSMINQAKRESRQANAEERQPSKSDTSAAQEATQPVADAASKGAGAVQQGVKTGGSYLSSAGGAVTGMLGGKKS